MKALLLSFLLIVCTVNLQAQVSATIVKSKRVNKVGQTYEPAFTAVTLDGKTITEKDLEGKVVFLNFWFEGCKPCVAEFGALGELYRKFKDEPDFCFVSFTLDDEDFAQRTVKKYKLPYAVCTVSQEECRRLNLDRGFPTSIVLDKSGKIVVHQSGGPIDKQIVAKEVKKFEDKITELLGQ